MGRIKHGQLFKLYENYLQIYLPMHRQASPNTILTYKTVLLQFMEFVAGEHKIQLHDLIFKMLNADMVKRYMGYLEKSKNATQSTRNNRLAAIRAFLEYASACDPEYMNQVNEVLTIKTKQPDVFAGVDYMTEEALQALLNAPDISTKIGIRDQFIMVMLYDTGARVQELLNIRICDLVIGKNPKVGLFGKGQTQRMVPRMANTVTMLKKYLKLFHTSEHSESKEYLFYTTLKGKHEKMSDDAIRCRINKYAPIAKEKCRDVPEKVYPHLFRHTRAMHLYQNGMDLTLISQWLGHCNLSTTLIYAHADTEQKREAILKATLKNSNNTLGVKAQNVEIDEQLLRQMYNL